MSFLYNSRLINQYNADDTTFAFYPIYMRRKGGGKLEKIVFCFLNIVVLLHKMKSRKFVVRFWLHWRPHTGWISISLEGFTKSLFTSWYTLLYIWLEGFGYPYWGFNIPLEGFRSFLGVYKLPGRISESLQWNFNPQKGYLNPSSGI